MIDLLKQIINYKLILIGAIYKLKCVYELMV
jgi:hypothetical protein